MSGFVQVGCSEGGLLPPPDFSIRWVTRHNWWVATKKINNARLATPLPRLHHLNTTLHQICIRGDTPPISTLKEASVFFILIIFTSDMLSSNCSHINQISITQ